MQPVKQDMVLVYSTYPSRSVAEEIGGYLVEHGLAACVNILQGMTSIYRWQGQLERSDEAVMLIKTRRTLVADVFAAVKERHPYDTPALISLRVDDADTAFGDWIVSETERPEKPVN